MVKKAELLVDRLRPHILAVAMDGQDLRNAMSSIVPCEFRTP